MKLLQFALAAAYTIPAISAIPFKAITTNNDLRSRGLNDTLAHGNYGVAGGQVWRYHQIRDGIFQGVSPEDWDDNSESYLIWGSVLSANSIACSVHTQNDEPHGVNMTMEERDLNELSLDRRDLNPTCKSVLNCAMAMGSGLQTSVSYICGGFTNIVEKVRGANIMDA